MKSALIVAAFLIAMLPFLTFTIASNADNCQPSGTNQGETYGPCPEVTGAAHVHY
jgi:hypothetical protein